MIVYTGRRGLHIFDIDHEQWVFNSKRPGHQYEDIYLRIQRQANHGYDDEDDDDDDSDDTEEEPNPNSDGDQSYHSFQNEMES